MTGIILILVYIIGILTGILSCAWAWIIDTEKGDHTNGKEKENIKENIKD